MTQINKVLYQDTLGDPLQVVYLQEEQINTKPMKDNVVVKMKYGTINLPNMAGIDGSIGLLSPKVLPSRVGQGGVGTVVYAGPEAKVKAGDMVIPNERGTHALYLETNNVVKLPDNIDPLGVCQLVNAMTVYGLFDEMAAKPGETVIITAANSCCSRMAIKYAKHKHLHVIAVVRRQCVIDIVKKDGAEVVISTDRQDLNTELSNIGGANHALDSVVGSVGETIIKHLHQNGKYIAYGFLSGEQFNPDEAIIKSKNLVNIFYALFNDFKKKGPVAVHDSGFELLSNGTFHVETEKTFALEDFKAAYQQQIKPVSGRQGMIVLKME